MALWGLVRTLHSRNLFPFQAYSLVDREVGYCQGSAFIVGLLLMQVRGHPVVPLQEMGTRGFPIFSNLLGARAFLGSQLTMTSDKGQAMPPVDGYSGARHLCCLGPDTISSRTGTGLKEQLDREEP